MPTDTRNRTFNTTEETEESSLLPAWECTAWIVLLIVESLAIVILNFITIIVFLTQRRLQRRGIYLLIRHLAMVDLLTGAISGALQVERLGEYCDVWEYDTTLIWGFLIKFALLHLFSFASLANLVAISLERVHATFRRFNHVLTNKQVYYIIVVVIWLIAVIREVIQIVFLMVPVMVVVIGSTLYISYYLISLLIICVSYISIFLKMQFGARVNSSNQSAIIRERQLTFTLFAVTVASLLSLLPAIIFISLDMFGHRPSFHVRMVVLILFMANSLVNPIIYSMKMRGFRAGVVNLFKRTPTGVNEVALPLPQLN